MNIIEVYFKKSSSKQYKKVLNLSKSLPNYSEDNDISYFFINKIKDYYTYRENVEEIIRIVRNWKNAKVVLYGKIYENSYDYQHFYNKLKSDSGKYAIMLNNNNTDVAINDITIEKLPLPVVYYPALYGCFFAFSNDIGEPIYFCECERNAINNYIYLRKKHNWDNYKINPIKNDFPQIIIDELNANNGDIEKTFNYKDNICFRCNKVIPKKRYCHSMYGGEFKQHYWWYVNQEFYNLGLGKYEIYYEDIIPENFTTELYDEIQKILNTEEKMQEKTTKDYETCNTYEKIERVIENYVREQLGFKKVGDTWISETMLYQIIKNIYPEELILRHHRPQWLNGLELDIYLPNKKLGLEYQGIQHFKTIEHWGGSEKLKLQQEHDKRKKDLCDKNGVKLICVNYDEPLNEEYIRSKLDKNN